ncbi:MAG: hypothetical protein K2Y39_27240 [Candidatus Obscuribacterales bacterium]|nr:hypothetical protein [Candidatus Obscuribacterales bacterium]
MSKTASSHCVRSFGRAFATAWLSAISLFVFLAMFSHPAFAVRVWDLNGIYEQPPGTPEDTPQLIVAGVRPDTSTLAGHRYINLKVVGGCSGKPVCNAQTYLVRLPEERETVVFNTDVNGETTLWNIEDCYRKLVVTDGAVSVNQWVCLPQGVGKEMVVKLPYNCLVSVKRPVEKCKRGVFHALRMKDGVFVRAYEGWLCCTLLRAWLPGGRYDFVMETYDKNDRILSRYTWKSVDVPDGKSLYVGKSPIVERQKLFKDRRF